MTMSKIGSVLISILVYFSCLFANLSLGNVTVRSGPSKNPEAHPDYGGTPDLSVGQDLELTVDEVESILKKFASVDSEERIQAAVELQQSAPGGEVLLKTVLWGRHGGVRNTQLKQALREAERAATDGSAVSNNVLQALLTMDPSHPEKGQGVLGATRIMGLLVALWKLNTMAGYKVMLAFSHRHAGAFRAQIGAMLVQRGMVALPALVYGRGSDDKELHMFSVKWIRDMGNPLLGEQIRAIKNPRRLAQLLEAYASVNELDAVDVTLALTNHDSIFVRNAARACIEKYEKNAKWAIRRTYENTFGKAPPENTEYAQWIADLYKMYDNQRTAVVLDWFDKGSAAASTGDFAKMSNLFHKILLKQPVFERRHEMAPGFIKYGQQLENEGKTDQAKSAYTMALRIAKPDSPEYAAAAARLDWRTAEQLRQAGVFDVSLYQRIVAAEPENTKAQALLASVSEEGLVKARFRRNVAIVSILLFVSCLFVYLRLRKA